MTKRFPLFKNASDGLRTEAGFSETIESLADKLKNLGDADIIKTIKNLPSELYDKLFGDETPPIEKPGVMPASDAVKVKKYVQKVMSEVERTSPSGKSTTVTKLQTVPGPPGSDDAFYSQILLGLGAPVTPENKKFMYAWRAAEGGTAAFNPFNTTKSSDGATNYNSTGVKNYVDEQHGIDATVKTLLNSRYSGIIAALRDGGAGAAHNAAVALSKSPWGTGDGVLRVLRGGPQRKPIYWLPEEEDETT